MKRIIPIFFILTLMSFSFNMPVQAKEVTQREVVSLPLKELDKKALVSQVKNLKSKIVRHYSGTIITNTGAKITMKGGSRHLSLYEVAKTDIDNGHLEKILQAGCFNNKKGIGVGYFTFWGTGYSVSFFDKKTPKKLVAQIKALHKKTMASSKKKIAEVNKKGTQALIICTIAK